MNAPALLLCCCLLLTAGCASQQATTARPDTTASQQRQLPPAEERAARQAEQLTTRLQLDEPTSARVEEIVLKYARRNEALLQGGGDRRSKFGQLRENSAAQDREMKDLLDDEQYAAYLELKAQQREQQRERMQQRGRGGRG